MNPKCKTSLEGVGDKTIASRNENELVGEIQFWIDHPLDDAAEFDQDFRWCLEQFSSQDAIVENLMNASDGSSSRGSFFQPLSNDKETPIVAFDRFRFNRLLGKGSFGLVVCVRDTQLERDVALKILRPSLGNRPRFVQRFVREAKAAASLHHPGIVALLQIGQLGTQPFIASEVVDGPNLSSYLRDRGSKLGPTQAAWLMHQIAEAVQFAHSRGVLHRDLKPSNVLLSTFPKDQSCGIGYRPKLTDFGLAKRFNHEEDSNGELSADTQLLGTVRYMSPEQAAGRFQDVGVGSDVFSLGIMFYELLIGKVPFSAPTQFEILERIIHADPTAPRRLVPGIPRDLEAITLKCLQKNPEDRYQTAAELAADLKRYLNGEPVLARPVSLWRSTAYRIRRNPRTATAIGALTLSMAMVFSGWLTGIYRESLAVKRELEAKTRADVNYRVAMDAIQNSYSSLAEKLMMGSAVSYTEQRKFFEDSIRFHEQLAEYNHYDYKSKHRLSVAHHYAANSSARDGMLGEALKHREACLQLLSELLEEDPNNEKYLFQRFMGKLLIPYELRAIKTVTTEEFAARFAEANADIDRLVAIAPDNPDYLDASAASKIQYSTFVYESDPVLGVELTEKAIDISTKLWERFPGKPIYAKHACAGLIRLAQIAQTQKNKAEFHRHLNEFDKLFNAAFIPVLHEAWVQEFSLPQVSAKCDFLIQEKDWERVYQSASQSIDFRRNIIFKNPSTPECRAGLAIDLERLSVACRHLGRLDEAIRAEQEAGEIIATNGLYHDSYRASLVWLQELKPTRSGVTMSLPSPTNHAEN